MQILRQVILLGLLGYCSTGYALQTILDAWQVRYPDSNSDEITGGEGCQLCHANPSGNAPWNAYGDSIRDLLAALNALGGGATFEQLNEAFENAENLNLDNDPSGATSLAEINNHYQPGWAEGAVNTIHGEDGPIAMNQLPPSISVASTKIDPAIPVSNTIPPIQNGNIALGLETVADGFSDPVMAARAPGLSGFLFVVEQAGEIWKVNLSDGSRVLFHDVDAATGVTLLAGGERGLLGLAFDPDYLNNGLFYTYQSESIAVVPEADFTIDDDTVDHETVISEWVTNNPSSEQSFSVSNIRRVIMRIEQPQSNHNGGMLNFGPDNYLYISLGDGGAADDAGSGHGVFGNSRDITNPLGAILRIDPQGSNSNNGEYGIPSSNPFEGVFGLDEIYAYGFRNPYRFSFDSLCFEGGQTCNTLFVGDVGQGEVEEINNVVLGGNYGWNWKEGSFFFYPPTSSVYNGGRYISTDFPPGLPNNLIDPVAEYNSTPVDGRSAVGGYVYRGLEIPELTGLYVFADFFQRLYYIDANGQIRRFITASTPNFIAGFGEDHDNELYVLARGATGALQKLVSSDLDVGDELCVPIKASNSSIALICL